MKQILFLFIISIFYSCFTDDVNQIELQYNRFEKSLFLITKENADSHIQVLANNFGTFNDFFDEFIMKRGLKKNDEYAKELVIFTQDSSYREAYDSVSLLFSDFSDIEIELNSAFSLFHYQFPTYPIPNITTFFGGFNYPSVFTYDNNIAIGLDFFLGKDSKYYRLLKNHEYVKFQKQKKYIVPNVMEVWFNEHFQIYLQGRDFLSQMIYKGKAMLFIDQMLPNMSIEDKFRFSKVQMDWVTENEYFIWTYFIEHDLLYSFNEQDFRTFLNYAPFAKGMPREAPGRIAYFIGYKMMKSYINQNNITVNELIYEVDSRKLLRDSKYKPRR